MELNKRAQGNPFICSVLINTDGIPTPLYEDLLYQNFTDTFFEDASFTEIYNSKGQASFSESGKPTRAGTIYTQKLNIRFPNADHKRSARIQELQKAKYIVIGLTNSRYILLGRNDSKQNTLPKLETGLNEKMAQVQFTTQTIFPSGYLQLVSKGFPYPITINP